jgi:hypothetical protein
MQVSSQPKPGVSCKQAIATPFGHQAGNLAAGMLTFAPVTLHLMRGAVDPNISPDARPAQTRC